MIGGVGSIAGAVVAGLVVAGALPAIGTSEPDQVLLPDGFFVPDDFGSVVAASDGTLVVGYSHEGDPGAFDTEFAHVFELLDGRWVEMLRLAEPAPGFAGSLVVDGDWIAATTAETDTSCGSVRLLHKVEGTWDEVQPLTLEGCVESGERVLQDHVFASLMALQGDRLAVTEVSPGERWLHVYQRNGSTWSPIDTIPLGFRVNAVTLTERWLVTAASTFDEAVRVYDMSAGLANTAVLDLAHPLEGFEDPDLSCNEVEASDTLIVVGCAYPTAHPSGAAFVFERSQTTWVESAVITSPVSGTEHFAQSVALEDNRILVGTPFWTDKGAAFLYTFFNGSWVLSEFFPGPGAAGAAVSSWQGWSVAIDGKVLVMGDPGYARHGRVAIHGSPSGRFSDDDDSIFESDIEWLAAEGIDFITYQRGEPGLAVEQFQQRETRFEGRRVRMQLAEDEVKVAGSGPWRRIVVRTRTGHQTPILTSLRRLAAARVACLMFARWRQENFFKYSREHHGLDQLLGHAWAEADGERLVPNPERRQVERELKARRQALAGLLAGLGQVLLDEPIYPNRTAHGLKVAQKGEVAKMRKLEEEIEALRERRASLPHHVPLAEAGPRAVLRLEQKSIIDRIKITAYNAEEMFAPASNGRVQSLVIASCAEFAWIVHIPWSPLLRAMSMSRLSASRTSPTTSRSGRMRRALRTS